MLWRTFSRILKLSFECTVALFQARINPSSTVFCISHMSSTRTAWFMFYCILQTLLSDTLDIPVTPSFFLFFWIFDNWSWIAKWQQSWSLYTLRLFANDPLSLFAQSKLPLLKFVQIKVTNVKVCVNQCYQCQSLCQSKLPMSKFVQIKVTNVKV